MKPSSSRVRKSGALPVQADDRIAGDDRLAANAKREFPRINEGDFDTIYHSRCIGDHADGRVLHT